MKKEDENTYESKETQDNGIKRYPSNFNFCRIKKLFEGKCLF